MPDRQVVLRVVAQGVDNETVDMSPPEQGGIQLANDRLANAVLNALEASEDGRVRILEHSRTTQSDRRREQLRVARADRDRLVAELQQTRDLIDSLVAEGGEA